MPACGLANRARAASGIMSRRYYGRCAEVQPLDWDRPSAGNAGTLPRPICGRPPACKIWGSAVSKRLRSYVRPVVAVAHDRCRDGFRNASSKQEGDL